MELNELFKLVQDSEAAFRKLGIYSDDYKLPHEVRMMAIALHEGKFLEARKLIKRTQQDA